MHVITSRSTQMYISPQARSRYLTLAAVRKLGFASLNTGGVRVPACETHIYTELGFFSQLRV